MVEFNSIEQALALQDEEDRDQMQLLGKTKTKKMSQDIHFTPDTSVFHTARHNDSLSLSSTRHQDRAPTDRMRRTGPIKGLSLGSHTSSTRQRNLLTTANFRSVNEQAEEKDMLKGFSTASGDDFKHLLPVPGATQAGSVKLDDKCLSCTGAAA